MNLKPSDLFMSLDIAEAVFAIAEKSHPLTFAVIPYNSLRDVLTLHGQFIWDDVDNAAYVIAGQGEVTFGPASGVISTGILRPAKVK